MKKFLAAVAAASLPALVGIAGEWYEPKDWDENGLPEYSATIKFYWTDEYGEQHITKEAVKVTEDGIMDKNGNPIEVSDIASGYLDEIRNLQSSLRSSDNEIRIANIADAVADLMTNSVHETWITNWTEAVEHITYEETFQIVNCITNVTQHEDFITNVFVHEEFVTNTFNHVNMITNWYDVFEVVTNYHEFFEFQTNVWNHENFITNVCEVYSSVTNYNEFFTFQTNLYQHEEFITNWVETFEAITNYHEFVTFETNMFEKLHYIENWTIVTNYIVRYLGGGTTGGGGEGGEGAPSIDPQFDPYSPEYIKDDLNEVLLPVRNALMMVGITNNPMEKIKGEHMFDWDVINTNADQQVQLRGFRNADASDSPQMPVKRKAEDIDMPADEAPYDEYHSGYALDWMEYPEELVKISGGNSTIKKISSWLHSHTSQTNILELVATNYETLAAMATNLFSHVQAETLLDNDTIWTNGENMVEIKGYRDERTQLYTSPFINWMPTNGTPDHVRRMTWEKLPIADDEAISRFSAWVDSTIEATTNAVTISEEDPVPAKILSLYGFGYAEHGQVPYKQVVDPDEDPHGPQNTNNRLSWKYAFDRAIKFKGTDGSSYTVGPACNATNTVTFASASDSNVRVHVAEDQDDPGSVRITIGVYYLTESALTPPVVE